MLGLVLFGDGMVIQSVKSAAPCESPMYLTLTLSNSGKIELDRYIKTEHGGGVIVVVVVFYCVLSFCCLKCECQKFIVYACV